MLRLDPRAQANNLRVDGIVTPETMQALSNWQRALTALSGEVGRIGEDTWRLACIVLAQRASEFVGHNPQIPRPPSRFPRPRWIRRDLLDPLTR